MAKTKMKRIQFENLIQGKEYFVICGIWQGQASYVGTVKVGKRIKYRLTYGPADNWKNQFGHLQPKSGIKVYELNSENC